jgi:hypothetical protein
MTAALKKLWALYGTIALQVVFTAVLVMRFLFPFFYNPVDRVYSDMNRHVDNGFNVFTPKFMNALDPKVYQLWMRLLYCFPQHQARAFDALFTGLLCASMMWFWYKALREFNSRNQSLVLSSLLGVHLSLLVVYGFYLIETMVITVTSLAVWMTLRAVRKHTLSGFTACAVCWVLAMFTKQTLIPVALLGLGYALYSQPQKWRSCTIAAALFVVAAVPAGLQSMQAIHIVAPFGFTDMQLIARKSLRTGYELHLTDSSNGGFQSFWWRPEAFLANPFDPIDHYKVKRENEAYIVSLDLAEGQSAWNKVISELNQNRSWEDIAHEYEENVVYLLLAPSWPDARIFYGDTLQRANAHLRWLWLPMFIFLIAYAPFARMEPPKMWILLVAFCLTWLFLLQDVTIIEGRYRKLIEPFLILSVYYMAQSWYRPLPQRQMSLKDFVVEYYLAPFAKRIGRGRNHEQAS